MGKLTISMTIFNSYVSLPEGNALEKKMEKMMENDGKDMEHIII